MDAPCPYPNERQAAQHQQQQPYRRTRRSVLGGGGGGKKKGGLVFIALGVFIMVVIVYLLSYTSSHLHTNHSPTSPPSLRRIRRNHPQPHIQPGNNSINGTPNVIGDDSSDTHGGGGVVSEIAHRWMQEHQLPLINDQYHQHDDTSPSPPPTSQNDDGVGGGGGGVVVGGIRPDNYLVSNAIRILDHHMYGSAMSDMLTHQINKMVAKINRRRGIVGGEKKKSQMKDNNGDGVGGDNNNNILVSVEALAIQAKYADLWSPIYEQFSGEDALDVASSCLFMTPECAFFLREEVVEMERTGGEINTSNTNTASSQNTQLKVSPVTLVDLRSLGSSSRKQGGAVGFLFSKCCLEHREMLNALACSVAATKSSMPTTAHNAGDGGGSEYDAGSNKKQGSTTTTASGLDVWPTAGTLLGLVREEGGTIIPWDTDIDLLVDVSPSTTTQSSSSSSAKKQHHPPTLSEDSVDRKLADLLFPSLWGRSSNKNKAGAVSRHFFLQQPTSSTKKNEEQQAVPNIHLQINEITLDGIISESLGSKNKGGGSDGDGVSNTTNAKSRSTTTTTPAILHPTVAASLRRAIIKAASSDTNTNSSSSIYKGKSPSTILLSKFMSLLPTTILEKHTISASFPFLSQIVVVQRGSNNIKETTTLPTAGIPPTQQTRPLSLVYRGTTPLSVETSYSPIRSSSQLLPLLSCFAVKANKQSDHGRIGAVIYGTSSFRHSEASRVEIWIRQESRKMQKAAINLPFYQQRQQVSSSSGTDRGGGFPSFNVSLAPSTAEGPPSGDICRTSQGSPSTSTTSINPSPSSAHVQSMINVLLNNGNHKAVSAQLYRDNMGKKSSVLDQDVDHRKLSIGEDANSVRIMNLACPRDPTAVLEAGYGPLWCRPCKHRTSNCKNV